MPTHFKQLNTDWNAEPNAPDPGVKIAAGCLVLEFNLNPFVYPRFEAGQRGCLRFTGVWRYRLGGTNDEGWYRGQCRFSGLAPQWGEFYEVTGDLLLERRPDDWKLLQRDQPGTSRHFLFYLRDETFECDAVDWEFLPRAESVGVG